MKNKIKNVYGEQQPYEKCVSLGPQSLSDCELLAVILRTGTRDRNVLELSESILEAAEDTAYPGLLSLLHFSIPELTSIRGIGQVKAIQLKCIGELSKRIAAAVARPGISFSNPQTIAAYYMEKLRHEEQEHLFCMMLDNKNHLLGEYLISRGTANATLVTPREIFIEALKLRALGVIVVHNHPSGDPSPSECDNSVTERIQQAGNLVGIALLDHIIIGDQKYFSFREQGLIQ